MTFEMRLDKINRSGDRLFVIFEGQDCSLRGYVRPDEAPDFEHVYEVVFLENGESAEYPRLVYRQYLALKLRERHRPLGRRKGLYHHYAVGRGLYATRHKHFFAFATVHNLREFF